jgi:hypothetical protein
MSGAWPAQGRRRASRWRCHRRCLTPGTRLPKHGWANAVSGISRVGFFSRRRGGRVAEGSGLLNRRTGSTRTVSSNLIPSARLISQPIEITVDFRRQSSTAYTVAYTIGYWGRDAVLLRAMRSFSPTCPRHQNPRPASPHEITTFIAALRYGRERFRHADGMMARITADWPVRHVEA